jgi:chemotaxis methyl-accepting protein methylase
MMPCEPSNTKCASSAAVGAGEVGVTDGILRVVHRIAGVDFSGYRPQTVERRIRTRMMDLGIDDLVHYQRLLHDSSEEVQFLIGRLTIKVSRFYRNPLVFDSIRSEILPQLARLGRPVRIWSAGCGRGEEAYTLAMLMEEAAVHGEVIATDIDPLALLAAREATFEEAALSELPTSLATRFLKPSTRRSKTYEVSEAVRARVAFQHADLTATSQIGMAPFDLVCCRNVLIYWNTTMQRAIFGHLLSHLHEGGWLCLGEAEWPERASAVQLDVIAARLRLFRHKTTESLQ